MTQFTGPINARTTCHRERAEAAAAIIIEDLDHDLCVVEEEITITRDNPVSGEQLRDMLRDQLPATGSEWVVRDGSNEFLMFVQTPFHSENLVEARAALRDAAPGQVEVALEKLANLSPQRFTPEQFLGLFATAVRSSRGEMAA